MHSCGTCGRYKRPTHGIYPNHRPCAAHQVDIPLVALERASDNLQGQAKGWLQCSTTAAGCYDAGLAATGGLQVRPAAAAGFDRPAGARSCRWLSAGLCLVCRRLPCTPRACACCHLKHSVDGLPLVFTCTYTGEEGGSDGPSPRPRAACPHAHAGTPACMPYGVASSAGRAAPLNRCGARGSCLAVGPRLCPARLGRQLQALIASPASGHLQLLPAQHSQCRRAVAPPGRMSRRPAWSGPAGWEGGIVGLRAPRVPSSAAGRQAASTSKQQASIGAGGQPQQRGAGRYVLCMLGLA